MRVQLEQGDHATSKAAASVGDAGLWQRDNSVVRNLDQNAPHRAAEHGSAPSVVGTVAAAKVLCT